MSVRAWVEDIAALTASWLDWAAACVEAELWDIVRRIGFQIGHTLRTTGRPDALTAWGRTTRQWLHTVAGEKARSLYDQFKWAQYNVWAYIEAGDLEGAERIALQAIQEERDPLFRAFLVDIAVARGEATPPGVVRFVQQEGVEAIDDYGQIGWLVVAREAAADGDAAKAFEALECAVSYWSNPPYMSDEWVGDAYWGALREHPEYKRIFWEKRQRIGPIQGQLHYFPGW